MKVQAHSLMNHHWNTIRNRRLWYIKEEKAGKEICESKKFLANTFALSYAEDVLNREGTANLLCCQHY